MGSARIKSVRQRLADSTYGGMGKFRKQGTDDVSDAVGTFMHNKFNEPNTRSEIMGNVLEDDKECKNEATCGQSSRFLKKKWDTQHYGNMGVDVKEIAGTYVGPGAEHSQAGYSNKGKPEVGHEWLELPDESIVDASAGQFINPKHKPLKQRQRFRIIPKESGLHKYYKKDKSLQNLIGTEKGREEMKQIHKILGTDDTATSKGMKQVKLPNGKIITVPDRMAKSARIQMARERLGAVGKAKRIKLHKDSYGLEKAMVKAIQEEYGDFTDMGTLSGSHFLTTDGAVVGSGGDDHRSLVEQAIQRHPDRKLRKMFKDPKMDRTDLMHEFMKQSGLVRINGSSSTYLDGGNQMSFSTFHPLSSGQRRFLNSHIENSGMSTDNISFDDMSDDQSVGRQLGLRGEYDDGENAEYAKLRQKIAGLGFRERILNWLKEQPRFKSFDPDSSFVGTVKYDQDNQSMQIELNGKKYDFCNVEERLFDSFSGAGSKGAFFNREIKSLHNCGAW